MSVKVSFHPGYLGDRTGDHGRVNPKLWISVSYSKLNFLCKILFLPATQSMIFVFFFSYKLIYWPTWFKTAFQGAPDYLLGAQEQLSGSCRWATFLLIGSSCLFLVSEHIISALLEVISSHFQWK